MGAGYIYELDLTGVPLRVAASIIGRERAPIVFDQLNAGSEYWKNLIKNICDSYPNLREISFYDSKKMIKRLAYAPLNGGRPLSWDKQVFV
jgi:hypothetical protein